jgi:hypothetical protein
MMYDVNNMSNYMLASGTTESDKSVRSSPPSIPWTQCMAASSSTF